jgi:hypothetical protein
MGNDVSSKLAILQESLLYIWVVWNRHVYLDGLQHNVETRHSLVLCLMMCPIGIISHLLTKVCIYLYTCRVVKGHWIYKCVTTTHVSNHSVSFCFLVSGSPLFNFFTDIFVHLKCL